MTLEQVLQSPIAMLSFIVVCLCITAFVIAAANE
jgi:hypothetical protein